MTEKPSTYKVGHERRCLLGFHDYQTTEIDFDKPLAIIEYQSCTKCPATRLINKWKKPKFDIF